MLSFFHKKMQDDKGFTLIELMVVVLIIAILIAIAIPTFLGLRSRSQNRAAQSDLRNALTAAKSFYTDADAYTGFDAVDGEALEPSLTWGAAAPAVEGTVSVRAVTATTVLLATRSASGTFFCVADNNGTTVYGDDDAADIASCTGGW
jgi:type IV pilus assembly protein PilA